MSSLTMQHWSEVLIQKYRPRSENVLQFIHYMENDLHNVEKWYGTISIFWQKSQDNEQLIVDDTVWEYCVLLEGSW